MAFNPDRLVELAAHLDAKAELSDARAKDCDLNCERGSAELFRKRAQNARHYANVCREAARLLKARVKRGKFVPPTWEELNAYCSTKVPHWPEKDRSKWFNHFQANGWRVGGKTQMVDWKAAARNGYANWREKNPGVAESKLKPESADPTGWREWLKNSGQPYEPYQYAIDYMQRDFQQQHSK